MTAAPRLAASNASHAKSQLDSTQQQRLDEVVRQLICGLPANSPTITGIAGAPGCGKSTLAALLCENLNKAGIPSLCLALDDYYLGRPERGQMAQDHHRLFATRGVPGTHDLDRLVSDMAALKNGNLSDLHLRRFDKSTDSVSPAIEWPVPEISPQHIFLEGWCIGAQVQSDTELDKPISAFESRCDPETKWRRQVNGFLGTYQERLWPMLDQTWYLAVPGWERVVDWRWQQERRGGSSLLKNRAAVENFLATFKRIVLQMLSTHRQWADVSLYADDHHHLRLARPSGR